MRNITYLATDEGWLYLCTVRDGCSRRVIGYAFSDSLHTDLVEDAMRKAVTFRHGDTPALDYLSPADLESTKTPGPKAAQPTPTNTGQSQKTPG